MYKSLNSTYVDYLQSKGIVKALDLVDKIELMASGAVVILRDMFLHTGDQPFLTVSNSSQSVSFRKDLHPQSGAGAPVVVERERERGYEYAYRRRWPAPGKEYVLEHGYEYAAPPPGQSIGYDYNGRPVVTEEGERKFQFILFILCWGMRHAMLWLFFEVSR